MPQTSSALRFAPTSPPLSRDLLQLRRGPHGSGQPPWPGRTGSPLLGQLADCTRLRIAWADLALCDLASYTFVADEAASSRATLLHVTSGRLAVELARERHVIEEGAALVCRLQPGDRIIATSPARVISVAIPFVELSPHLQPDDFEPRPVRPSVLVRGFGSLVEALVAGGPMPPAHAIPTANAITAMQVAMLSPEPQLDGASERPLAARLLSYIDSRLTDPALTPDTIAAAFGISRRTVYNLLAAEDIAVARYIREKRLAAVARYLENQPKARPTDLAHRFGFTQGSQLTRAFQAHFGVSVAEYGRCHSSR